MLQSLSFRTSRSSQNSHQNHNWDLQTYLPYKLFLRMIVLAEAMRIEPSFSFQTTNFTELRDIKYWYRETVNQTEFCDRHKWIEVTIFTINQTIELTFIRACESEKSSTSRRLGTLNRLQSRSSENIDYRIVPLASQTRRDSLDIEPGIDIAWRELQERLTRRAWKIDRSSLIIHHRYRIEQSDIVSSIKLRDFCTLASESLASACIS